MPTHPAAAQAGGDKDSGQDAVNEGDPGPVGIGRAGRGRDARRRPDSSQGYENSGAGSIRSAHVLSVEDFDIGWLAGLHVIFLLNLKRCETMDRESGSRRRRDIRVGRSPCFSPGTHRAAR